MNKRPSKVCFKREIIQGFGMGELYFGLAQQNSMQMSFGVRKVFSIFIVLGFCSWFLFSFFLSRVCSTEGALKRRNLPKATANKTKEKGQKN